MICSCILYTTKLCPTLWKPFLKTAMAIVQFIQHKVLIITNMITNKQLADLAGGRKENIGARSSDVETKLMKL